MIEAGKKAKEAGFDIFVRSVGIAARKMGTARERDCRSIIKSIPIYRVRTFIPKPGSRLYTPGRRLFPLGSPRDDIERDKASFRGASVTSQFLSDHVSNLLPLHGKLPEEKTR